MQAQLKILIHKISFLFYFWLYSKVVKIVRSMLKILITLLCVGSYWFIIRMMQRMIGYNSVVHSYSACYSVCLFAEMVISSKGWWWLELKLWHIVLRYCVMNSLWPLGCVENGSLQARLLYKTIKKSAAFSISII